MYIDYSFLSVSASSFTLKEPGFPLFLQRAELLAAEKLRDAQYD